MSRVDLKRLDSVFWFGGVGWEGTSSTELRMLDGLRSSMDAVWFASPARGAWAGWWSGTAPAVEVDAGMVRARIPGTPGLTRWPIRALTSVLVTTTFHRLRRRYAASAIVLANPIMRFPKRSRLPKILYITDDWVSGCHLMGLSEAYVRRTLAHNARCADAIIGVSDPVLDRVRELLGAEADRAVMRVIPNGATHTSAPPHVAKRPVAVLIGQLNHRIDLGLVEAVADAGIEIRIVGPRAGSDAVFRQRLDRLAAHTHVDWRGPVSPDTISDQLADAAVGITPYIHDDFNRASSPLKTFDYLAAGLPVVSTDLPASRALGADKVRIATSRARFVSEVAAAIDERHDHRAADARHAFAMTQTWTERAEDFMEILDAIPQRNELDRAARTGVVRSGNA